MNFTYSGSEPQPSLAWTFESSNVDTVTGLAPSSQVSPGPGQLQGGAALVTNAPTSNTAVYFPGVTGSYMNLGASSPAAVDAKTSNIFVECWVYQVNSTYPSFYQGLLGTSPGSQQWVLQLSGGTPALWISGPVNTANFTSSVPLNTWTHISFSWALGPTSNTAYFYINGASAGSVTSSTPVTGTLGSPVIGNVNSGLLNGYIRDLRVVQGGIVPTATFTPGSAPFTYALPSYVTGSGSTVFTLLGQFVTYVPGKYSQALSLVNSAAVANYITTGTLPVTFSNTVGFTCSFWINFNPAIRSNQYPLALYNGDTSKLVFYFVVTTGLSAFRGDAATRTGAAAANMSLVPSASTWYHMALTVDATTWNAYINGQIRPEASGAYTSGNLTNINGPLWIGAFHNGFGLTGLIDDLRIYNTALAAAQVQSVYSSQGAPAPSRVMPLPRLAWNFDGTTTDYVTGLVGTTTGSVTYNYSGKYGQSLSIINAAGSVTSNTISYTTPSFSSRLTVMTWIKFNTIGVDSQYFFEFGGSGPAGIDYVIDLGYFNNFRFRIGDAVGATQVITSTSVINAGQWYHVAAIIDGYNQTLYVNGVISAGPSPCNTLGLTYNNIRLGGSTTIAHVLVNGELDDLRIYDRALTSAQVQSVYNQQGLPGRVKFGNVTGTDNVRLFNT